MTTAKKTTTAGRQGFKTGEAVVYPAHGVGRITAIEEQEIAGYKLELFVVSFEKDKMVLRVPTAKANSVGMRKLAEPELVKKALDVLTGRARDQAHHVVAPRPGIRGQDQFGRPARRHRGGARPVSAPRPSPSSPTASVSSTRPPSTGSCARSRR